MIGKLYSGKPTFRFDEGVLEIEPLGYYASSLLYCRQRFRRLDDLEKSAIGFLIQSFLPETRRLVFFTGILCCKR